MQSESCADLYSKFDHVHIVTKLSLTICRVSLGICADKSDNPLLDVLKLFKMWKHYMNKNLRQSFRKFIFLSEYHAEYVPM